MAPVSVATTTVAVALEAISVAAVLLLLLPGPATLFAEIVVLHQVMPPLTLNPAPDRDSLQLPFTACVKRLAAVAWQPRRKICGLSV